ncbi:MAG TPA: hypothetical protein VMV78_08740 [Thiobacillus sp.]|jgi:hypothetical protein|nr:hypothetical protein [Thiobacillus sp.]
MPHFNQCTLDRIKLSLLNTRRSVRLFDNGAGRDLRLMNIQSDNAFMDGYQSSIPTPFELHLKAEGGGCQN